MKSEVQGRPKSATSSKIGILTFHRCINYGSYWQARCLVEGLRARGHGALLLDYECATATSAEWRCAFRPLLPARTPPADYRLYGAKTRKFLKAIDQLPQSGRFPLDRPDTMEPFDIVIVGSDEVWNLNHPWYGGRPAFYGQGLNARRVVSYAASFGSYDASAGLEKDWADRLRGISCLSVRDENSRRIVLEALGESPPIVLDPCLQFPPSPEEAENIPQQPYVLLYGHSLPGWFQQQLRHWAWETGHRLVSIGYRNDIADHHHIAAGPDEFAQLFARAAAVATNFFHGCIFALINGKPFACAPSDYRINKLRDLTALLHAERHLADESLSFEQLDDLLTHPLDPSISVAINALRAQSSAFLDRALG